MARVAPWLAGALVVLALGFMLEAPLLFFVALILAWIATLEAMSR